MSESTGSAKMPENIDTILSFIFEVGYLKRIPRAGWLLAGATSAESVAEHVFRTAIIGYVLANLEGADPFRTAVICLLHDLPEARITDLHPVAGRYLAKADAEKKVTTEAYRTLDANVGSRVESLIIEYLAAESREAIVARDADQLECIIQACEYRELGLSAAEAFLGDPASRELKLATPSARALASRAEHQCSAEWWREILRNS
jgi:putative hydrolase of HD superfamily